jgi:hypothetical protein
MDSEWERLIKRYVWNAERTPYFTRVANLSLKQAHYELFGYALLVGVLAAVLSLASLAAELPHAGGRGVSLYAFSVCCAAVLLGTTRHPWAALWCAGAPVALLAYFAVWGFHPALEFPEQVLLVAIVVAWLLYSPRAVAVARAWQRLAGHD